MRPTAAAPVAALGAGTIPLAPAANQTEGHLERLAPSVISIGHWTRLLAGVLYAVTSRVDWAILLRRSLTSTFSTAPSVARIQGGTATIIARDTSPVAIAVDANAIYWSDTAGQIMRLDQ